MPLTGQYKFPEYKGKKMTAIAAAFQRAFEEQQGMPCTSSEPFIRKVLEKLPEALRNKPTTRGMIGLVARDFREKNFRRLEEGLVALKAEKMVAEAA